MKAIINYFNRLKNQVMFQMPGLEGLLSLCFALFLSPPDPPDHLHLTYLCCTVSCCAACEDSRGGRESKELWWKL